MKILLIATTVLFSLSFALAQEQTPPETVTIPNKKGPIKLDHKAHSQRLKCSDCHGEKIGKLLPFGGLAAGHKACLNCHKEQKAGPTACNGCHGN